MLTTLNTFVIIHSNPATSAGNRSDRLTYHQTFDRLGNPVARRVRFVWLRRISESADLDGIFIVVGVITAIAIVSMWMSGVGL